ncbi:MAG TPA: M1 family metallopeptidase [Vicinamibacterales bacterium]|nr:M1 family metallopeptidase [Vicinamibacterales bacterium]HXR43995.1 M1 family metallopeptidase [Pseudolysinimonas sp.]
MQIRLWLSITVMLVAAACSSGSGEERAAPEPPPTDRDIHSFARPWEARVTHVALDLTADFASKTLAGKATLSVERTPAAHEVVLDTRDLTIQSATAHDGRTLKFKLGTADPILGRPLTVELPPDVEIITIAYRTSPGAAALQWLAPSQTAGKVHPYLYSQGQAILTRTWIPTQDSPGIRQTYAARIIVPRDLRAVMSAEQLTPDGITLGEGRAFEFRLKQAIPPYLIALAVGDLQFRQIGGRTGVYAEPSVVEAAADEFADLEKMVMAAESLLGPYLWGRYDVLVLPPSFPFGGMENPRLTFATPTVLAGDRSLVSLVAHELAHSWSGNLVTNATWSDFWLNEGFTTYVENRIMELVYGKERAEVFRVLGWRDLAVEIERLGGMQSKDTILHVDLKGRDPDDGATQIPYEKGAALLRVIERTVGRERFDAYLKGYFERHAFMPITTTAFLADIRTHLLTDEALEAKVRLEDWVYKPAIPDNAAVPQAAQLKGAGEQAQAFARGAGASSLRTKDWSTQEWQYFLAELPQTLSRDRLVSLDKAFGLTERRNSEVLFDWLRIAIRHHYEPAMPALEEFLLSQGRRKFVRPLFEDLMKTDWGKAEAKRIYAEARPLYHSVTVNTLDEIVK